MSDAAIGHSATLVGTSVGTIGEVLDINGPGITTDRIDATNMDSTSGWAETIPGIIHGGEFTFDINYVKGEMASLYGAISTSDSFTLTLPDASTWTWTGWIADVNPSTPWAGKQTVSVAIVVNGVVTFASS
jgi:hypothetical protein